MALEAVQAEIGLLITQMENQPQDRHELQELLREKIAELRAFGMPVPQDLLDLEEALQSEFGERLPDGDARGPGFDV